MFMGNGGGWHDNLYAVLPMKTKMEIKGRVRFILENVKTGEIKVGKWKKNLIPLVGKTAIVRRLRNEGTKSNEGIITYGAVGTSNVAPASSNTTLGTELIRKTFSSVSNVDNVLTLRIFFTTAEANGSIEEFGLFGEEATSTADTGTLFERVLYSETKTTDHTLTVEAEVTIV